MRLTVIFITSIFCLFSFNKGKQYVYEYFPSGKTKAEGWKMNTSKIDYWTYFHENGALASKGNYVNNVKNGYWYFYTSNGSLLKEGHYKNNIPADWWTFHNKKNNSSEKCLYIEDGITRYCLVYTNNKLIKACKYKNDIFLQQWTTISSFKQDNPHFKF